MSIDCNKPVEFLRGLLLGSVDYTGFPIGKAGRVTSMDNPTSQGERRKVDVILRVVREGVYYVILQSRSPGNGNIRHRIEIKVKRRGALTSYHIPFSFNLGDFVFEDKSKGALVSLESLLSEVLFPLPLAGHDYTRLTHTLVQHEYPKAPERERRSTRALLKHGRIPTLFIELTSPGPPHTDLSLSTRIPISGYIHTLDSESGRRLVVTPATFVTRDIISKTPEVGYLALEILLGGMDRYFYPVITKPTERFLSVVVEKTILMDREYFERLIESPEAKRSQFYKILTSPLL